MAGIASLTAACGTPSTVPTTPDIIAPSAAFAATLAPQREEAIFNADQDKIKETETYPVVDMDVRMAGENSRFHATAKPSTVTSVTAFVPHQATYPGTFVAVLKFSDGTGALMGFYRARQSDRWDLSVYGDIPNGADLGLVRDRDGFAPAPFASNQITYEDDPEQMVVYYVAKKCEQTPPCRTTVVPRPPGARTDAVSGAILDDYVAGIAKSTQSYANDGFQMSYSIYQGKHEDFPGYRLTSGGSLRFFTFQEDFFINPKNPGACFDVKQAPGAYVIDPLLPDDTYKSVGLVHATLAALEVPKSRNNGGITAVAAFTSVVRTIESSC